MSKVCKNIMYFWCLMLYLQLFLHDNIPNNNKIRPIKILSIHCSRYLAYRFTSQIRCITINKTNDQVELKTFTRMLNTWKHGQKQNVTNVVCCNIGIHYTRIKRLISNEYQKLLARKLKRIDHIYPSIFMRIWIS
jgi:predicted transport protein